MPKQSWAAEKRSMEKSFNFITGKRTKIIDIVPPDDSLGYTSKKQTIHLAYDHPTMDGLNDSKKAAFRKGVFAHEMCHQIFTSFNALEKAMLSLTGAERRIFGVISNVLEDPAIEYWAPTAISGPLLSSLRFSIAHIYKNSPNIDEATTAFSQYVSALIQFGDMGLIKGRFTFPEAKKIFAQTADLFEQGIVEPSPERRIDISKEIFEMSRPLWQEEVDTENAMQEIADMLSKLGKSAMSGSGRGQTGDSSPASNSQKNKRRRITIKKVSKEEMEELKKNAGAASGPIPEDADVTIYTCDETSEDEDESEKKENGANATVSGNSSGDEEKDDSDSESSGPSSNNTSEQSDKEQDADDGNESSEASDTSDDEKGENGKSTKNGGKENSDEDNSTDFTPMSKNNPYRRDINDDSNLPSLSPSITDGEDEGDCSIKEEEYQINEEDLAAILSEIEREEEGIKKEAEASVDDSSIPDFDVSSGKMPQKSCLNYRISFPESHRASLEQAYMQTYKRMKLGIHTTTKTLKNIFEDDKEEREYRSSGRISLKRLCSGSVTDHIFEKKITPADKKDLAVVLLVDESGSMQSQNKYLAARDCCIALAEVFNNLKVPVYVIGFTADTMGYDIVHSHYVTWKNTKDDRLKLLNISARADNCDGASIRYATEIIKKKHSKNKLLIVISDGRPVALNYPRGDEDTKDAIKAAKKHASVLGVAVGNSDTEKIQYFYENDFLHVSHVSDLFSGIAKAVKKIIKKW